MPPKRKAPLAEVTPNQPPISNTRGAKKAKTSSDSKAKPSTKAAASKSTKEKTTETFKYSAAKTLAKKPVYVNLQWPNIGDFEDDEDQDMPQEGELLEPFIERVSDLGLPVSEDASKMVDKFSDEVEKRNQESRGIHIYSDWSGYGIREVVENHIKSFNKDIFKQTVSPYKKWAYVEAIACCMNGDELAYLVNIDDPDGLTEVLDMVGVMVLTTIEALSEHGLFKPDSGIKNIPIMCLMLLEYFKQDAQDLECHWDVELVRACDEAGIDLTKHVRKQVDVDEDDIEALREKYREKQEVSEYGGEDGNGYKAFAKKEDWTLEDDLTTDGERMWYRWDWNTEYEPFLEDHPGGTHYDLTKKVKQVKMVRKRCR